MAGQKNVKYGNATNQTQQFVKQMIEAAEKLPAGAKMTASTEIKGAVELDDEGHRDLAAGLEIVKGLVGEGKVRLDYDLVRKLVGQAEFTVSADVSLDKARESSE